MKRRTLIYKALNVAVLLSMLFGIVPPAMAAPASSVAQPTAPSERASDWPSPESPAPDVGVPFPDPTALAIERALEGVEFELLDSGSLVRPEPLTPNSSPSTNLAMALDPVDLALERALGGVIGTELSGGSGLVGLEPLMPYSPLSTDLSRPSVLLPTLPDPLAEINNNLPQPSDLAALAERAEAAEETPDSVGAKEDETASESVATLHGADAQPTESEDTPAAVALEFSISDLVQVPTVIENEVSPAAGQLALSTAVTTTHLPVIMVNSDGTSTLPPSDQVTVTPKEGGILDSWDGWIRLEVPPEAVVSETVISYRQLPTQTIEGFQSTGNFFELTARDNAGNEVTQFNQDLNLHIQYNEIAGLTEAKLQLYYLDKAQTVWIPISSTVDVDNNTLTATVHHFTQFAPLAATSSGVQLISTEGRQDGTFVVNAVGGAKLHLKNFDSGVSFVEEPDPDDGLFYVGPMAVGSRVGFHFTDSNGNILPFSGYDLSTSYGYWAYNIGSQPLFVGQKASSWDEFREFLVAYEINGGADILGPPDSELVHDWGGYPTQGFLGGNGHSGSVIMYNSNRCAAFQVKGSIFDAYADADGPSGWLGGPISNELIAPPEFHEHTGEPISYFDHGIITRKPGKSFIAQTYYPFIGDVYVEFTEVGTDLVETGIRATVMPVPGFPDALDEVSVSGSYFISCGSTGGGSIKDFQLENQGNNLFVGTIGETLSVGDCLSFFLFVERLSDGRRGQAPIGNESLNVDVDIGTYGPFQPLSPDPSVPDCTGGGYQPPLDTIPPEISEVGIRIIEGSPAVFAKVTDNWGVVSSVKIACDTVPSSNPHEMDMVKLDAPDKYGKLIDGYEIGDVVAFAIAATDPAGNIGAAHGAFKIVDNGGNGISVQGVEFSNDPVNTRSGNYVYQNTDIEMSVVGTPISIKRVYNSNASIEIEPDPEWVAYYWGTTDGMFGPGWSTMYDVKLDRIDATPLIDAVQIYYEDGRVATFIASDDTTFVPETPGVFDRVVVDGDNYILLRKDLSRYTFNQKGCLTQIEDPNDNLTLLNFDNENLVEVLDASSGRKISFFYDDKGHVIQIKAPESISTSYSYVDGYLSTYTDARGNATEYKYDERGRLVEIKTPKGHNLVTQTYDKKDRVDWQLSGKVYETFFEYDDESSVAITRDKFGNATRYEYDDKGHLIKLTDAKLYSEFYVYNDKNNITYFRDKEGREWSFTFDEHGNKLTESGPQGWYREWDYSSLDKVTRSQDAEGRETFFDYDEKGNLVSIVNSLGITSSIVYDSRGLPEIITDFNGYRTYNVYSPETGDLLQSYDEADNEMFYIYDDLGRLRTVTNKRGFLYSYYFDDNNNLVSVEGPLGYRVSYEYDENDNRTAEIDPLGGRIEYIFDGSEHLVLSKNQLGHTIEYVYNDLNLLEQVTGPEGQIWTYDYDAIYNLTAMHGPEDTYIFYVYDSVRNVIDVIRCNSPLSGDSCAVKQVTHYEYDDLDRVICKAENHVPGAGKLADTNVTTEYVYDLVGNLLILTDANGNATTYEYDDLNRLVREEDAENQITRYGYDANSNLTSIINPRGYETTFTYDGANRLETTTDAAGSTWIYAYDGNSNLTDTTDPLGVITHNEYDELDRLSSVTLNYLAGAPATVDQNVTTRFAYDLAGNLRFVYDPRGTYQTEHRYDDAHRRILTIDAEGGETEFGYDKVNNLVSLMDANDHETTYEYDGLDRQVRVTNPEGHSVWFEYDRLSNLRVLTDARGNPTTFTYDGMNRLVLRVDVLLGQWVYEYDAMGNLLRHIDANGHANDTYTYDKVYRLETSTDAEGYVTSFTYDENGNMRTLTDGNTHTTTYDYDELDRLASVTNAEDETTRYRYDPLGNQTHLIEADGIVTLYGYDPLYRLTSVTQNYQPGLPENADTNVDTHYGYGQVGNLLSILDAEEHETSFSYDGLNRLTQEVDALGNTWDYEYDFVSNRTVRIDAKRDRTEYEYYPDDQLKHISYYDGTSVHYTYDENNNRLTMQDHLGTTIWVYDALNRVTDVTDPFDRHLGYAYDPVSNRTGLTYADGRTVNYTYYDNNWLKTAVDPEGNVTSYERDGVGQVTRITNPNSTISTMAYDKADRLLSLVNYQVEGAAKTNSAFGYTYDEVGQRTQMVAEYAWRKPNEIVTSNYTYDGLRRLIRDEDSEGVWTEYEFDRVGNRLVLRTNDSSLSTRPFDEMTLLYSYNDINQVLTIVGNTHPGSPGLKWADNTAQPLHAFRHEVTAQRGRHINEVAADNLLAMADALIADLYANPAPKVAEVTAAIQALRDHLIADWASGAIDSDGIANSLLVKLDWGDEANNAADKEFQTTTYLYDANGNRVNKEFPGPQGPRVQGTDYTYDPENRLVVAHDYQLNLQGNRIDRQITRLEYDGDGRRLVKEYDPKNGPSTSSGQAGSGTKRVEYVFDDLDPVAEYNLWNPQYENFYRGDLKRIITMHHFPDGTQGQMYWFHYDGLGSTSGLTKHRGQSHHNYRYKPYGQIEMPSGNFTDPHNHYTFSGKEWDKNTNLYYFGARHYDPIAGVWLTQDTYRGMVSEPMSLHRYSYVHGNPINYYDEYGNAIHVIGVVIVAAGIYIWAMAEAPAVNAPDEKKILQEEVVEYKEPTAIVVSKAVVVTYASIQFAGATAQYIPYMTPTAAKSIVLIGGATNTAGYLVESSITGEDVSFEGVIANFAGGTVGGIGDVAFPKGGFIVGGASDLAGNAVTNWIQGKEYSVEQALVDFIIGGSLDKIINLNTPQGPIKPSKLPSSLLGLSKWSAYWWTDSMLKNTTSGAAKGILKQLQGRFSKEQQSIDTPSLNCNPYKCA